MKKRPLWLTWYSLYILCVLLGFIPEPTGFWVVLRWAAAIGFFIPGGLLIKWALDRGDHKVLKQVRTVSVVALALAAVLIMLNFASALMTVLWGKVLYVLLIVLTGPVCCVPWAVGLFGWACLMVTTVYFRKK